MALTKATLIDLNANELILDLDADTSITADTDDTIDFRIGGSDEIKMTSTALTPAVADGSALGTAALEWADLFLADSAVINLGADQDVTLTHVHNTGLLLNSTMALQFNDASQYINAPSATVLDVNATDEIELNATLVDINANVEISGTTAQVGVATFTAVPVFPNDTIETADVQDNAVTLAKMAGLARGKIIYGNSSGNPTALTVGSSGQALVSDGTDISWGSGGAISTYSNSTNNRVLTSVDSSSVNSEANLTFDGSTLAVTGAATISSTLGVTGVVSGAGFTAGSAVLAEAELELLDGLTAGTAIASKVVTTDASIDTTGQRNLTITGELDAATLDISGAIDIAGASVLHGALTQDGGAIFNEASADVDFRVESDDDANMIFVDGGNDRVGIGTASPSTKLEIYSAEDEGSFLTLRSGQNDANHVAGEDTGGILFYSDDVSGPAAGVRASIRFTWENSAGTDGSLVFRTADDSSNLEVQRLRLMADGRAVSQFTARAWVDFSGSGTPAIHDSHNVSSITDISVGNWNVILTEVMASTNYAVTANAEPDSYDNESVSANILGTNSIRLNIRRTSDGSGVDNAKISSIVFGD